ncbi:MAG: methyl-accepting chemotaxis protein [Deltaproteobacteria bacterium]|nr:methyl-accepting chemotaxis protein [Deltaproteobacteria bacterium]
MNNNSIPKFRRRQFFIKKGLQARFVIGFTLAVLLGYFLNLLLVYFLIDRELTGELYKIHLKIRTTSEIAVPILWKLSLITIPIIIIISALIGYILTRRVEVPLLKFKKALRKTAEGDFTQVLKDSVTGDLPEVFNSMGRSLETNFKSLKNSAEKIDDRFNAFYADIRQGKLHSKKELSEALGRISEARHEVWKGLEKFKI